MNTSAGGEMARVKEASEKKPQAKSAAKQEEKGRFVWHELATLDPKAAETYYTKVIGWGTTPFEGADPEEPYTMWTTGETPRGGLMLLPEMARKNGAPSHWLTYIGVADADKTVEKVKSLGGKVFHGPETIPNVGRFAVLADPQGAVFAVIKGEGKAPPASEPRPGEFSWHELTTTDAGAAWKFYSDLFGWQKTEAMDMGGGEMYQMFGFGGPSVGGMSRRTEVPPHWMPYVIVKDVDATVERIKAGGGKVMLEPMEVPGGDRIAIAADPQGAALGVHEKPA
jgi:predicted enzyme related to lactoylglutathione lyase